MLRRLKGHYWTVAPSVRHMVVPHAFPPASAWRTTVRSEGRDVVVRGWLTARESDTLLVSIHGLGGTTDSPYQVPVVRSADQHGWATLRLALRGTDGIGNDFYHAGLTDDLNVVLGSEDFARYERIFFVGFSLGGHIALRLASQAGLGARARAVVAVCPPIDLAACGRVIDSRSRFIYRQNILIELKSMYRSLMEDGMNMPTPWERVKMVKTIREWDALTVVPRFGFGSVDNYYETQGAKSHLHALVRPAMMVHSRHDPMVPPHTVEPGLADANDLFEPRWFESGGHTFFPGDLDLGRRAPKGIGPQIISWLDQH